MSNELCYAERKNQIKVCTWASIILEFRSKAWVQLNWAPNCNVTLSCNAQVKRRKPSPTYGPKGEGKEQVKGYKFIYN